MTTPERRIRDFYGFAFPDEFFRFREFLAGLKRNLLADACDMAPAFAFDVAAGRKPKDYPKNPLWEDRYYNDLPEFVTLFKGTVDGLHWGYFFDAPDEHVPIVVHYWHSDTFEHAIDGKGLFEAVRYQVESSECEFRDMADDDPDEPEYADKLEQVAAVRTALARFWGADREETAEEYMNKYDDTRWRKWTAATRTRMGIVVPRKQYRKLSADPFAAEEVDLNAPQVKALAGEALGLLARGYPGAALKLGHDLWVWAEQYPACYELLDAAYAALGREPLRRLLAEARAFRQHCDSRRHRPR